MRGHDRFESLSGAVALGEASVAEREELDRHAAECARCRADVAGAPVVSAGIAAARDQERWQPSLAGAVSARVRERSAARSRITIATLAWAAGLSIAGNLIVVTGFASAVLNAFAPAQTPTVLETAHVIRLPATTFAHLRSPQPPIVAHVPRMIALHRAPRVRARPLGIVQPRAVTSPIVAPTVTDPLSDVLADEQGTHQRLAVEMPAGGGTALQP